LLVHIKNLINMNLKQVLFTLCFTTLGLITSNSLNAQDGSTDNHTIGIEIPEVALVDIEPAASKNITMNFTAPTEAGDPIEAPDDNTDLWINVSSIKSTGDPTRTVSVKLTALVPGVDIKVTAAADAGQGAGTLGTPGAQLTLTTSDQSLVTGIGSGYTGNGASSGYNLTYNVSSPDSDYSNLSATSATATVTYTISDN
jgi:hypothetical protein